MLGFYMRHAALHMVHCRHATGETGEHGCDALRERCVFFEPVAPAA